MAKTIPGHKEETVTLTLHNYDSLDSLLAQIQWPKSLTLGESTYRYSENEMTPVQMSLGDFRIEKEYSTSFRSGENTWYLCTFYNRFGIKIQEYIRDDVFENMPYTVWMADRKNNDGRHYLWCGHMFRTEEEAQAWVDAYQETITSLPVEEE